MTTSTRLLGPALLLVLAACNDAPTAPTVSIGPDGATTTDPLVLSIDEAASDPNDDTLVTEVRWLVDEGAGFADAGRSGTVVPAGVTRKGQTWRAEVITSDGVLTAETASAQITVQNTPPVVRTVRLTPESIDTLGTLTATALAEDADEDALTLDLTWYVDGVALDVAGTTLPSDAFTARQEVWFEVTPRDDEEAGETVASPRVVIENTPPKVAAAHIEPAEPDGSTPLSCGTTGWFDLDGDPESYRFSWLVDGVEVATGPVLAPTAFDRDDLVRCRAVPFDGDDEGRAVVSPGVVIANTAPTVTSVALDTATPRAGDVVGFTVDGADDADGDEVRFEARWLVDGEVVAMGDTLPAFSAVRGQQVVVEVTPTDGTSRGAPVASAPVAVVNTPPRIAAIDLTPTDVYTDTVLTPLVTAEDVDGDRVSYTVQWTVDGVSAGSGATLDGASAFAKGAVITATLTPSDGVDTGTPLTSDAVTVLDSPPTRPIVAITPAEPSPGEVLRCEVLEDSVDADGDPLTTALSWTLDGASYTGATTTDRTGDTVPASDTADGDVYTCTYTVEDGSNTVTASSMVEVLRWRGPRAFDTCGVIGREGPTSAECAAGYSGTLLEGEVTVAGGRQVWTAPLDGDYRIVAAGAAGAAGTNGTGRGYAGAEVAATLTLSEGDEVTVLVGQTGESDSYSAGGGGGTFVWVDGSLVLAAGGGGGNGYSTYEPSGCEGQGGATPRTGSGSTSGGCSASSTASGSGGADWERESFGFYDYYYFYGGGGAGWSGDGEHFDSGRGAEAISDGGLGGDGYYVDGGFGGGGAGGYEYYYFNSSGTKYGPYRSDYYGSGGGGGYTGGDGGYYRGGGGSSYTSGADVSTEDGANTGQGRVSIDLVE